MLYDTLKSRTYGCAAIIVHDSIQHFATKRMFNQDSAVVHPSDFVTSLGFSFSPPENRSVSLDHVKPCFLLWVVITEQQSRATQRAVTDRCLMNTRRAAR